MTDSFLKAIGPAIMSAYLTPLKGLGCRSGSYLVYGAIATMAWLLFFTSSCLSHQAMLHHQRVTQKALYEQARASQHLSEPKPESASPLTSIATPLQDTPPANENGLPDSASAAKNELKSTRLRLVTLAAALTRWLGKLLVVLNTGWIIVASLLEFVGTFDNCWCKTNAPGLGANGSVVLFKGAHDLAHAAQVPWVMVCALDSWADEGKTAVAD